MIHVAGLGNREEAPDTTPPSGPPTSPQVFEYGGAPYYGVQWTNGDSTAHTEIGNSAAALSDPAGRDAIVSPGTTSYQTSSEECQYWFVRHVKNGQYTAWVLADDPAEGCGDGGGGGPLL